MKVYPEGLQPTKGNNCGLIPNIKLAGMASLRFVNSPQSVRSCILSTLKVKFNADSKDRISCIALIHTKRKSQRNKTQMQIINCEFLRVQLRQV